MKALQVLSLLLLTSLFNCTSKKEEVVSEQQVIEVLQQDENLQQFLRLGQEAVQDAVSDIEKLNSEQFFDFKLAFEKRATEPQKFTSLMKKYGFENRFDSCFEKQKRLALKFAETHHQKFSNFTEAQQRFILREALLEVSKGASLASSTRRAAYCEDFCAGTVIAGSMEFMSSALGCAINFPSFGAPFSNCFSNSMNSFANSTAIFGGGMCAYCCIRESNCR